MIWALSGAMFCCGLYCLLERREGVEGEALLVRSWLSHWPSAFGLWRARPWRVRWDTRRSRSHRMGCPWPRRVRASGSSSNTKTRRRSSPLAPSRTSWRSDAVVRTDTSRSPWHPRIEVPSASVTALACAKGTGRSASPGTCRSYGTLGPLNPRPEPEAFASRYAIGWCPVLAGCKGPRAND